MRLLVVEQNEFVSKIFKKIFDEKQYEADFVKNDSECSEDFAKTISSAENPSIGKSN